MSEVFSIGLREGLEASVVVAALATLRPVGRRWSVWSWVVAGFAVGVVSGAAMHPAVVAASVPAQQWLEFVVSALAVVVLVMAIRAVARRAERMRVPVALDGSALSVEGLVMALAVWREVMEATLFLASGGHGEAGLAVPLVWLVGGAGLAVAVTVVVGWWVGRRGGDRRVLLVAQGVLGVLVAGMAMATLRAAHDRGLLDIERWPLVEVSWLGSSEAAPLRSLVGLTGVNPSMSLTECLAWVACMGAVAVSVARAARLAPSATS